MAVVEPVVRVDDIHYYLDSRDIVVEGHIHHHLNPTVAVVVAPPKNPIVDAHIHRAVVDYSIDDHDVNHWYIDRADNESAAAAAEEEDLHVYVHWPRLSAHRVRMMQPPVRVLH